MPFIIAKMFDGIVNSPLRGEMQKNLPKKLNSMYLVIMSGKTPF
jgi:hypothetical protein